MKKLLLKETIRSHFDQSPIKNRIIRGEKIKNYSDLSRFLALKSLEESLEKTFSTILIPITKRIDSLESYYTIKKFAEKVVDSIENIELCGQCGKVVIAKIGGIRWWRKGTFQCGEKNKMIASWCSKKCYDKHYKSLTPKK